MRIEMNSFARNRHKRGKGHSYYSLTEGNLLGYLSALVLKDPGCVEDGYRDGVKLINVEPAVASLFYCNIVKLHEKTSVSAKYEARKEGEEPRKSVMADWRNKPMEAKAVQIVVYRNDVLAEDGDNETDPAMGEAWEIVSINASPYDTPTPITPEAAIYNHLQMSGGTASNMSDEDFVKQLRESMEFWKNHAFIAPAPTK